jgi:drug/metabolite transporter (DMT)-like permease
LTAPHASGRPDVRIPAQSIAAIYKTPFRENLNGIVLITVCNLLFLISDTLTKVVSANLPLGEIITIRGTFAILLLMPLVLYNGVHRQMRSLSTLPVLLRIAAEIFSAFLYLVALLHIPIANSNAINQIIPLTLTAAGAIFFGEAVGWRRWAAITAGLVGVLIVVRPGLAGFNAYSLLALASAFFVTLRDVTTRMMPRALPALLIALVTGTVVGLCGPIYGALVGESWVVPQATSLCLLFVGAFFLIGGYLTAVAFMRHGDISVVAPFRYVVIVFAILVGFLVWHDVPDGPMLLGTLVIAASGIYTFSRERNLARLAAEAAAGEGH